MEAFHSDPKVKAKYLARVMAHRKADEIIHGSYWGPSGKGCAVGCTIHGSDHSAYERELGIPTWLARVEDTLFEGMNLAKSKTWPERFLRAIKPGADLSKVKPLFLVMVLKSALKSFNHKKNPEVKKSITRVIALWKRKDIGSAEWKVECADAAAADAAAAAAYAARRAKFDEFSDGLLKILKECK